MPDDPSIATIHALAVREMLNLPKLYGPNGFINILSSTTGTASTSNDGPPADLIAALEGQAAKRWSQSRRRPSPTCKASPP